MTDKITEKTLNSEMAYPKESRLSVDDLIQKKKQDNQIIQTSSKEHNDFVETNILCHQALELAETTIREIADDYNEREQKIMEKGFKMLSEPFIPEYAGFTNEGSKEGSTIYKAKDYILARIGQEWVLIGKGDSTIHLNLENMYQAVATLSALGLDISFEDVLNS